MLASEKAGISVYALTENRSAHAQTIINKVCQQQGETFSRDPYVQSCFTDPIDVKLGSMIKASVNGGSDPNFLILYLRDERECDASRLPQSSNGVSVTKEKGSDDAGTSKENGSDDSGATNAHSPILSSAIINIDRDERGWLNAYFRSRLLLFFYFLPYFFSWGPRQFFKALFKCFNDFFNCELYAEMTEHLGVRMSECFLLEYFATDIGHIGKGYGKTLIKVLHEMADAKKKHILIYSSSKKNVPFYERFGYEQFRDYGKDCTLMFRRYKID